MPGWAVEGPDGVAGTPTRPPVVTAGVDAQGNIRRILTDTTGAQHIVIDSGSVTTGGLTDTQLRASAVPVSLAALPALAAGSAVIGHVIVDSGAVTATQATSPWVVAGGMANNATMTQNSVPIGAPWRNPSVSLSNGQFGDLEQDGRGALKVTIMGNGTAAAVNMNTRSDGQDPQTANLATGAFMYVVQPGGVSWDRARSAGIGDAAAATGIQAHVPFLYNGSTYDRQYGDKTNGAWVNATNIGSPTSDSPAAFTVLDQLNRIRRTEEANSKTLQAILVAVSPAPVRKTTSTLLHRS